MIRDIQWLFQKFIIIWENGVVKLVQHSQLILKTKKELNVDTWHNFIYANLHCFHQCSLFTFLFPFLYSIHTQIGTSPNRMYCFEIQSKLLFSCNLIDFIHLTRRVLFVGKNWQLMVENDYIQYNSIVITTTAFIKITFNY